MTRPPLPVRVDTFAAIDRYLRSVRGRARARLYTAARVHAAVKAVEDLCPGGRAPVGLRARVYIEATNYPTRFSDTYQTSRALLGREDHGWYLLDVDRIEVDATDPPPVVEFVR